METNQSLNQLKPKFSYLENPSIIRAQITAKPASRDVSFSSYLKPNDPILPLEASQPAHATEEPEISIFDAEKYFNGAHDPKENRNKKPNNTEVSYTISPSSIGRLSLSTPKQSVSSISRPSSVSDESYGRNYRARSFHATPTASSEASWNSQTGLLTNPPGLAPVSIRNLPSSTDKAGKKTGNSMKWLLRGNRCPCSGKKSVNVQEKYSDSEGGKFPPAPPPRVVQLHRISCGSSSSLYSNSPRTSARPVNLITRPSLDQNELTLTNTEPNLEQGFTARSFADGSGATGKGFTFPVLDSSVAPTKRVFNVLPPQVAANGESAGDPPRDSIEVFQPRDGGVGRNFTFPGSPKSRRASYDDDVCSDASSDLFEIESFSATGAQMMSFPRRDSLDDPVANFNVRRLQIATLNKPVSSLAVTGLEEEDEEEPITPSVAPTECYPPSEVSVDWSVTTAEGFDRASVAGFSVSASEAGYAALREAAKGGAGDGGENKRRSSGGLLMSCRCEKAVNVGPGPMPASVTRGHVSSRTQAQYSAQAHVNSTSRGSYGHGHGVSRSTRSALMSVPFAT